MTEKELQKLNRAELLELFLEQCRRNETLEKELAEVKAQPAEKNLKIEKAGSLAEASLALTNVFEEAQKAADLYLENVRQLAEGRNPEKTEGFQKVPEGRKHVPQEGMIRINRVNRGTNKTE